MMDIRSFIVRLNAGFQDLSLGLISDSAVLQATLQWLRYIHGATGIPARVLRQLSAPPHIDRILRSIVIYMSALRNPWQDLRLPEDHQRQKQTFITKTHGSMLNNGASQCFRTPYVHQKT